MRKALFISIIDQGALSALSLAMGLLLVRFASPEGLGQFTLAMSVFFVFSGVQFALVSLPISTRIFEQNAQVQAQVIGEFSRFGVVSIVVSMALSAILFQLFGLSGMQSIAGMVMVGSSLWRELSRSVHISSGATLGAARMDVVAVITSIIAIVTLWFVLPPEVACLAGLAVGNLVGASLLGPNLHVALTNIGASIVGYRQHFGLTRWALGDSLSQEMQTRGYVFLVQILRGDAANGLLQAGRIITSPISMVGIAWSRIAIPRLAADVRAGRLDAALRQTRLNILGMLGLALLYAGALYMAWTPINGLLFADRYPDIGPVVAAWCGLALIAAPAQCMIWLFQAMERFRELAILGVANMIGILLACAFVLWADAPVYTVLGVMAAGQLVVLIVLGWRARGPNNGGVAS